MSYVFDFGQRMCEFTGTDYTKHRATQMVRSRHPRAMDSAKCRSSSRYHTARSPLHITVLGCITRDLDRHGRAKGRLEACSSAEQPWDRREEVTDAAANQVTSIRMSPNDANEASAQLGRGSGCRRGASPFASANAAVVRSVKGDTA